MMDAVEKRRHADICVVTDRHAPEVYQLKGLVSQVDSDPTNVDAWQAIIDFAVEQRNLI